MEYRMYCLAERHLSPMQKAIQSAHAIMEYTRNNFHTIDFSKWLEVDKTIIILDGGTSEDLVTAKAILDNHGIKYAEFFEPDMGGFRTAICFLANELVFDKEQYGISYDHYKLMTQQNPEIPWLEYSQWFDMIGGAKGEMLKDLIFSKRLAM